MEGFEFDAPPPYTAADETDDFCNSILTRFSSSTEDQHHRLCAIIGAMSQELKDQKLPLTPIAYFGATCSSLDRLSAEAEPPSHVVEALLTILSTVITHISAAILKKKSEYVSELLVRILRSKSITPGAAVSGLKCVSHLLIIREKVAWSDLSSRYGFVLAYVTDDCPKVRRQSHMCLRDVLLSFQRTSVLAPASEAITSVFERRITKSWNPLSLHPTVELSPEVLLDLLCSLGLSISANEMSVDDMTFTARLLDVGMKKIYSLNRQICIVKLPLIFNALRDILASEHEEALFAATEAFKSVIHACIDGTLIKQGVDQIIASVNVDTRKSRPTIIEKICATIENLLDYRYAMVWDMSFQVVSTMFDKLGVDSPYLLKGTLENLADMQKLPDEDFPYRKQFYILNGSDYQNWTHVRVSCTAILKPIHIQKYYTRYHMPVGTRYGYGMFSKLHECIGSALGAMGPETFLSILPLKLEAEDLSEANVWLFPILKQYTIGARLGFFTKSILAMVGIVKKKSQMLECEGKIYSSRSVDGLVYSLWSLLPSFCNYPLDVAESFKDLEKALSRALREEPDVHGIICSSLQILIRQNKAIVEGKDVLSGIEVSIPRQQAMTRYTPQVAADNLSVLRSSARELLSVLSGIFLKSSNDAGGCLQTTIGEFASISDKAVVTRFFKTTMQKLLKVTQEASKAESSRSSNQMQIDNSSNENSLSLARAQLFDLAVAFLPGLDASEIDLLFIAVKPALKDVEGFIQKKAYKVLSSILTNSDGFLLRKHEELLNLMIDVLPSCHFSAKRHRLNCLYFLIVHVSKDEPEQMRNNIISSFLTEIVLALKEANKKTRNKAYDILVQIGHACGDEEKGGKRENLHQFFNMVAGGLAGETPHMISAARKNNEIAKANLGLLKVLVAKSQAEGLQMHLKGIVEGLLKWQDSTKNLFKAKIKVLLEMLVKKCGLDAVKAVMPEEHMKLLTNIRKIKERKERRVAANSEESKSHLSKATTSRLSRWNHTKIFSDFGDEETDSNPETVSGRRSKASALLTSEASSLPLSNSSRSKRTRKAVKSLPEDLDDEPEIDSEGRLVIRLGGKEDEQKREMSPDPESDGRSQAGSHVSMNSQRGQKRGKHQTMGGLTWGASMLARRHAT
ncbi:RRP12-like protein [Camellia lanceoleosa]|uniref:RRP12-like protein n=1 Tax=Camellia lanceoleosa TaxID=1840588 RepID=A0ACC0ID41_9ERIC|nr:RRP12-like protein [Camellia lanceoleosa]